MSNAAFKPEQDVGGSDDLPTYENLAQAHGPNSRYGNHGFIHLSVPFDLVPKVRSVEKLGRKEVSLRPNYRVARVTTVKELPRGTPMSLQRNGSAGNREVGVMA
jgi:hypothetical protein